MNKNNNVITLYPSNWLYNAGVVGLKYLDEVEEINEIVFKSGTVNLSNNYFDKVKPNTRFFNDAPTLEAKIIGNSLYPNFINPSRNQDKTNFHFYLKSIKRLKNDGKTCLMCGSNYQLTKERIKALNKVWSNKENDFNKFYSGISEFSNKLNGEFGGASSLFPNGFWNYNSTLKLCPLCIVILLHHHLAVTKLADKTSVFINATSFKEMYELNKIVKHIYGTANKIEVKEKREILAMTVIEYSQRINNTLGIWTGMNIEVVKRYNKKVADTGNPMKDYKPFIEFFSLPYDLIKIITDRKIAAILSELGELKILSKVLDRKYKDLVEIGYKLLRLTNTNNENERKQINSFLFMDYNRNQPTETASKILRLYSLIEEKNKRS